MKILLLYTSVLLILSMSTLNSMELRSETDEQFIARTRHLGPSQKSDSHHFNHFEYPIGDDSKKAGLYGNFEVQCPHHKYTAIFRVINKDFTKNAWFIKPEIQPQLVIINSDNKVEKRRFLTEDNNKKFQAIALSGDRRTFAIAYRETNNPSTSNTTLVKIQKIDAGGTSHLIVVPDTFLLADTFGTFAHAAIAFNKQGDKIIVWGVDVKKSSKFSNNPIPALHYQIFSVPEYIPIAF